MDPDALAERLLSLAPFRARGEPALLRELERLLRSDPTPERAAAIADGIAALGETRPDLAHRWAARARTRDRLRAKRCARV